LSKKKNEGLPQPLHPMLARARDILEPMFVKSVLPESGHGLLATQEACEALLDTMPDAAKETVGKKMKKEWYNSMTTPEEKWEELKMHLGIVFGPKGQVKKSKSMTEKEREQIQNWTTEVVFKYTYPRLDINVSKMQNHLLKSPFCVHPKTGRVCVPIQVEKVDEFDPFQVPTLDQLMKELDDFQDDDSGRTLKDWQKTSLKSYFEPFQKQFLEPMMKDLRRSAMVKAEEQAAMTGNF
jgi:DNA primase small subunit